MQNLSVFQASAKNDVLKVCRKEYEVCVCVWMYLTKNQMFFKFCKKYPVEERKSRLLIVVIVDILIFIHV